ncbi:MAG: DHA2 family efflux MFS transporter permease subunit [Actinomycetota bacterium]
MDAFRDRLQSHRLYRWFVLVTVGTGMMMAILSSAIVNIALPSIAADFGSSIPTITWVATMYMIIQATLMPVSGRAGDIYGHKKVYIAGLFIFTAMSILCTFAWDANSLIAARGLQAVGTSAIAPMALSFVFEAFPGRERAQALGIMGGILGAAPVVGLTLGGVLVEAFGWRSVFLVAVPLCLAIAPLAFLVLKESEPEAGSRSFDVGGGVLLSAGMFGGLLGLSQGRSWGWDNINTLSCFAAFAVLLALFVLREMRIKRPMLDLGLFKFRSLTSANVAGFFSSGAMFGTFILLPFYFQSVLGDKPAGTGFKIAPLALMFLLMAPLGGRLTTRLGARMTTHLGLLIAGAGFLLISFVVSVDASGLRLELPIAIMGIGLGLTMAPLTTAAMHDVPPGKRGIAASLPNMSRFVGASFGMAIVGTFLTWRLTAHLAELGMQAGPGAASGPSGGTVQMIENPVVREAFAAAFQDVFRFTLLFVVAGIVAASFVPPLRHRE